MASLMERMRRMGLGDVYDEMATMAQEIVSDSQPELDQPELAEMDADTLAEIEAASQEYDLGFGDAPAEEPVELSEFELAQMRQRAEDELAAIRERATQAGRARFAEEYGEPEEMPEEVVANPVQTLQAINQQGLDLAGNLIQAMQSGNIADAMQAAEQLGALREQGDSIALGLLQEVITGPSREDTQAAQVDADALAAEGETFTQPQPPGLTPEEADALLDEADARATAELTAAQQQAAQTFSANTLIFDIYVKGCVFTRRVPADRVIKGDSERAREAATAQASLPLEAEDSEEAAQAKGKKKQVARKKLLFINKKMLEGPELDAIVDTVRQFKNFLALHSLECSILKGGKFVIPTGFVAAVEERYQQFRQERRAAVRAFILAYPRLKEEARARFAEADLSSLFDETQYPGEEELPQMFQVAHSWTAFDAPKALQSIKAGLWEDADRQIKITLAQAADEARDALRASFAEYTGWLCERLTDDGDESKRKKGINEGKVAKMLEFLQTVDGLNLSGDADLTRLVAQARDAVQGLDVDKLRKDGATRETVRAAFAKLQEETASWVVDKSRTITFEEDAV